MLQSSCLSLPSGWDWGVCHQVSFRGGRELNLSHVVSADWVEAPTSSLHCSGARNKVFGFVNVLSFFMLEHMYMHMRMKSTKEREGKREREGGTSVGSGHVAIPPLSPLVC